MMANMFDSDTPDLGASIGKSAAPRKRKPVHVGELVPASAPMPKVKGPAATFEDEANEILERVKDVVVTTQDQCSAAVTLAFRVRAWRDRWRAHEYPTVKAAKTAYDTAKAGYDKLDKPLSRAENLLKNQIGRFKLAVREVAENVNRATNKAVLGLQTESLGRQASAIELAAAEALEKRQVAIGEAEARGDVEQAARLRNRSPWTSWWRRWKAMRRWRSGPAT